MARVTDKLSRVLRSLGWWTILIYMAPLIPGWLSACGASYIYGDTDTFSLSMRSSMQIAWIAIPVFLGMVLVLLDDRFYDTFSCIIYVALLVLLLATIFNPHGIKGSRSWLVLGPIRLQPAEFAKFATVLAMSKFMGHYGFDIHQWEDLAIATGIALLPMFFITVQKETGSALVYLLFFLMFYREGMPGSVLFIGVATVTYLVLDIKYEDIVLWSLPVSAGKFMALLLVQVLSASMVYLYCKDKRQARFILLVCLGVTALSLLSAQFVLPFDAIWVQLIVSFVLVGYLTYCWLAGQMRSYPYIALFVAGSVVFFYSADYVLDNVMKPYQRVCIIMLLGLEEDVVGVDYNVHQSEIATDAGGLGGKGFLNGTQTKLKSVSEQDIDSILCTVEEEEGFTDSVDVLVLFLALILRLIELAERQSFAFGHIYGYCVTSIFLFHASINAGMVLGFTPVIGIPLPFLSYGGSSPWGFTLPLFIFLRIDVRRNLVHT